MKRGRDEPRKEKDNEREKEVDPTEVASPPKKAKQSGDGFRLNSKQLFLTYPQCPMGKEEALLQVEAKLGIDPVEYLVAEEKHQVSLSAIDQAEDCWYHSHFLPFVFE